MATSSGADFYTSFYFTARGKGVVPWHSNSKFALSRGLTLFDVENRAPIVAAIIILKTPGSRETGLVNPRVLSS